MVDKFYSLHHSLPQPHTKITLALEEALCLVFSPKWI